MANIIFVNFWRENNFEGIEEEGKLFEPKLKINLSNQHDWGFLSAHED